MNKYSSPFFWEQLYHDEIEMWKGLYRNEPITKDSVIVFVYALNANTFQYEQSWVVYPNTEALLGFLKYIYLPTVMIGLLKNESEYDRYYSDDLGSLIDSYEESPFNDYIPFIKSIYNKIDTLWEYDRLDCIKQLKATGRTLAKFRPDQHIHFYFDVFQTPVEMAQSIVSTYEWQPSLDIHMFEEQIGMSKEQWIAMTSNIYENIFLKRRFVDILSKQLSHSM